MNTQTVLSDAERDLLLDLLLREQRELPPEIHRTHNSESHEILQGRLKVVAGLLERLQQTPAAG